MEQLKQSIIEEGEKVEATIKVSDRMEARLSGYMFQITAITPEIQAVSKTQQTEWIWAAILVPVTGWLWKRKKKQRMNPTTNNYVV